MKINLDDFRLLPGDKPINEYLSKKISIISLFSAFAVVLIHCYNPDLEQGSTAYFVERFFSQAFCRSAVPFFFASSGFLLCATLPDEKFSTLLQKLKKRVRTIFIPWLLWLCIYLIFFWGLYRFLSVWNKQIYLCDWQKSSEPVWFILKEYIWGDGIIHLWFLKRLMLFFVFSPVFIFLIKRFRNHR